MHLRPFHIFKFTKHSHIVKILTLNDVLYWSGDTFISVVLALFVTQYINGASASSVGVAYMIYKLSSSITTTSAGKFFDKHKGFADEIWALFLVSFVAGLTYIALSFGTELWHLYLAMGVLGVAESFDINSWKLLFYTHLEKNKQGRVIGTYDAIYGVSAAAMAALAGFIGEAYGFRVVIFVAGLIVFASGLPILSLKKDKSV